MTTKTSFNCQEPLPEENVVSPVDCFSGDFIAGDSSVRVYEVTDVQKIRCAAHFYKICAMRGCTVLSITIGGLQQAGGARLE